MAGFALLPLVVFLSSSVLKTHALGWHVLFLFLVNSDNEIQSSINQLLNNKIKKYIFLF